MSLLDALLNGLGAGDACAETFAERSSPSSLSSPRGATTSEESDESDDVRGKLLASGGAPELARRVAAFRRQIAEWTASGRPGVPLLILPEAPEPGLGQCISCGVETPEKRWRCPLCLQAVHLALGMEPPDEGCRREGEAP